MATWLTHLRIAEKIKEKIKDIDLDYFMAGSIAPDSGKPDKTNKQYEPSEEITHFCRGKDEDKYIDLKDFYNKHLRPEDLFIRSDKTRSFYWGYYFHLVGDSLWNEKYFKPMKKEYNGEGDFAYLIREEMYALDFEYLEKNPQNNILCQFETMKIKTEFFTEFSPQLIYENIEKIKDYYDKQSFKLNREYKLLNAEDIEKFIDITVEKSIEAFY